MGNEPPWVIAGRSRTTFASSPAGTKFGTTTCANGSVAGGVARKAAVSRIGISFSGGRGRIYRLRLSCAIRRFD